MNRILSLLGGLCIFLLAHASPGHAATQVCGIDLSTIDGYDWDNFKKEDSVAYALQTFRPALLANAMHEEAIRRSPEWPPLMGQKVVAAAQDVEDGAFDPSDFKVDKFLAGGTRAQQFAFPQTDYQFELPPDNQSAICAPNPMAVARVGKFIELVNQAYAATLTPAFTQSSVKFALLEKRYDKYLFEGFPMWPWEAWANGELLTDDIIASGPPRNQLAMFHPSAGILANVESDANNDLGANLMVEALGWVHYSEDYETWWGVSAAAVLPFDRNPGYGLAFTYKQFKLGVTWHDDDDYDGIAMVLNLDFYQFISEKYKDYSDYLDKVRSHTK